jgi:UDPglucose 6-dehydrogenase
MALHKTADEYGYEFKIIEAVTNVNDLQKKILFTKLNKYYKDDLKGRVFALWGLAFKPDTDDIREAPAIEIINMLLEVGAKVQAFDPEAGQNVARLYADNENINIMDDQYKVLKSADALLIATEWAEFRTPDFDKLKVLKDKAIFDGRNLYDPREIAKHGLYYESIGRKAVNGKD